MLRIHLVIDFTADLFALTAYPDLGCWCTVIGKQAKAKVRAYSCLKRKALLEALMSTKCQ